MRSGGGESSKESSLIGPKRQDGVGKRTIGKMERQKMDGIGEGGAGGRKVGKRKIRVEESEEQES